MSALVFLLEEKSAKNMLEGIVPRLVPEGVHVQYMTFSGKQDLEKQMVRKIRLWLEPDSRFIILRDQDSGDCTAIRTRLLELAKKTGKADVCLVRIACHELESFFLGDLAAVTQGLNLPALAGRQNRNPYRRPDSIANAAEELKKLTGNRYGKLAGSRATGPCLSLDGSNRSHSFGVLVEAIYRQASLLPRQA